MWWCRGREGARGGSGCLRLLLRVLVTTLPPPPPLTSPSLLYMTPLLQVHEQTQLAAPIHSRHNIAACRHALPTAAPSSPSSSHNRCRRGSSTNARHLRPPVTRPALLPLQSHRPLHCPTTTTTIIICCTVAYSIHRSQDNVSFSSVRPRSVALHCRRLQQQQRASARIGLQLRLLCRCRHTQFRFEKFDFRCTWRRAAAAVKYLARWAVVSHNACCRCRCRCRC